MEFLNLHGLGTFLNELKTNFVNSFNGRKGNISPTKGDYSIDKISPTSGATEGQIPVLVNNGTEQSPDLEFEMQNVPSGGHVILNPSGTEMTQRDDLQFSGYFTVSDDSTNGKTVVSDEWETITWANYNALTDQQRAGRHFKITGAPIQGLSADIVGYDNTTSGLVADDLQDAIDEIAAELGNEVGIGTCNSKQPMSNAYLVVPNVGFEMKTGSYLAVIFSTNFYYSGLGLQMAIGSSLYNVRVNGEAVTDSRILVKSGDAGIFVYDGTYLQLIRTTSGGHIIYTQEGSNMPQESGLQFGDAFLTDDSLNGRTVVENIKEHTTKADYDNATEDGFHVIDDGNDVPIGEIEEDVVSVTADGNTTYAQLLTELKSLIDKTKLQYYSTIVLDKQTAIDIHNIVYWDANTIVTSCVFTNYAGVTETDTFYFGNSVKYQKTIVGNVTDMSSEKPSNGTVISLHYGTSSGIVELNTDARHCMMSDGVTSVEDTINGTLSGLSVDTSYISVNTDIYQGYSRSGYMHNLSGVITILQTTSIQQKLVNPPSSKYMPDKVIGLFLHGSDGNLYSFGFHKTMGLYSDNSIPAGVSFRFNITWYKKY